MKDRRTLLYLLILAGFLLSMMTLVVYADNGLRVGARSSVLYNPDTGMFLHFDNASEKLPMASTTKIMTAIIAIESLPLDKIVTIPKEATGIEGSSLYLKEGDQITVKDLLYGLLLQSANDAAEALAIAVSGNTDDFAKKMTDRAKDIGANDTCFKNPHGLDAQGHYTTARDLALIASSALENETFCEIAATRKYSFSIGEDSRTVINHNKLLKLYDSCIGVKTGYTKKSGRCLVGAAKKNGITLISVTLNDPDDWVDHRRMLDFGFERLQRVSLYDLADIPADLPTVSGDGVRLKIGLKNDSIVKYINEDIECTLDIPRYIAKDTNKCEKIGTLTVKTGNREEIIDIIALDDVKIRKVTRRFI